MVKPIVPVLILILSACTTHKHLVKKSQLIELTGKTEQQIVTQHCQGRAEYVLPDRTRVDCLTSDYAWEYDRPARWAEAIGQALHYAAVTRKKPGIVLICSGNCNKEAQRIKRVNEIFGLSIKIVTLSSPN